MTFSKLLTTAIATVAACQVVGTAGAQTPIAHWTFDDGINDYNLSTITDRQTSGGTSNLIWADDNTNGLNYTGGIIGGAARMSGTGGDFFNIVWQENPVPDNPQSFPELADTIAVATNGDATPGTGITWSMWIDPAEDPAGASYQGLLMSRDVTDATFAAPDAEDDGELWGLAYRNINSSTVADRLSLDGRVSGNGINASASNMVPAEGWHHIAMTWGADENTPDTFEVPRVLYIDGVEVARTDDTGIIKFFDSGAWLLGNDVNRLFRGLVDDVAVFGSRLDDAQILALYNNGLAGTNASGVVTTPILPGDVDGMNGPDMADFTIILNNLGKNVTARNLGDLDGSGKVDLDDYQAWLEAAPAALHAEAFAALGAVNVPEPSAAVLLALACGAAIGLRYRKL